MRIRLSGFAVALVCMTICCGTALAGTVYKIRDGATAGGDTYPTLADFKAAVVDAGLLISGDVIELHNDDFSLAAPLDLPTNLALTIRSVGGHHTVQSGFAISDRNGPDQPDITIENVRIVSGGPGILFETGNLGTLSVKNSVIEDSTTGMMLRGNTSTTITNTAFTNNTGVNAIQIFEENGNTVTTNVVLDSQAPLYTHWASENTDRAIEIRTNGDVIMGFDIAGGKKLVVDGTVTGTQTITYSSFVWPEINLTKTGAGVLKFTDDIIYYQNSYYAGATPDPANDAYDLGRFNLDITEGTVHFGEKVDWYGFDSNYPVAGATDADKLRHNGTINVGANGTIRPSISAGDLEEKLAQSAGAGSFSFTADATHLALDRFTSQQGARFELGGVSNMPFIGSGRIGNTLTSARAWYRMASISDPAFSNTVGTLSVNNKLLEAYFELCQWSTHATNLDDPTQYDSIQLRIERIENLAILEGVGEYADVYRRMDSLTEYERDMLDDIYNRGGAGSDVGFLQTIGGQIVQNAMLALRHNQANLIGKINSRLTAYRKEELELEPEITGSEVCYYSDDDPIIRYGELWAAIDQTWMNQKDVDNLAGYRYNAHGVTIGYDHHWDNMIAGGVLNYTSGTMKLRNNSSTRTDVDNIIAALYASWACEGWYASGTAFAAYGWNDSESVFHLPPIAALTAKTGNYKTSSLGANVELGYMMETEFLGVPMRVTPYGSMTYARLHRNAVRENGASDANASFDRQFRAGNWNVWDAALGVRLAMPMDGDGYILIPSVDASWTRTMGDPKTHGGDAHFIHDPSASWSIPLMSGNRSSVRVAAGVDARFRNNLSVGANYELEWRENFWKNQLNLSASLEF